jgi:hypothetical protein
VITSWVSDLFAGQRVRVEAPWTAWRAGFRAVQKGARLEEALDLALYTLMRGLR